MKPTPLGVPRSASEHRAAERKAARLRAQRQAIRPYQEPENSRIVPGSDEAMALPSEECLDAAVEILDSCRDELARYDRALRGPGPRPQVSVYALMFGVLLVIAMRLDGMFITDVVKVLRALPKSWRKRLGLIRPNNKKLSDRQVRHRLDRLVWVIGELCPSFADMPAGQRIAAFANRLIQLHLEGAGIAPQDVHHVAADSSSIETPAAVLVDESVIEGDKRYTKDPEAGPNFWPAKNGRHNGTRMGFDLHTTVLTSGAGIDGKPRPGVIAAFVLAYPNKGGREIPQLFDLMGKLGYEMETVRADRGISNLMDDKQGGNFHVRLAEQAIRLIHDLGPTHRKPAPDVRGVVWVDSSLCCPCAPAGLIELPAHSSSMTKAERLELASRYDTRDQYHFEERQRAGVAGGGCRLECPARAGKVRCPLVPESMVRGMDEVPTIPVPDDVATPDQIARLARVDPEAAAKLKPAPDCCVQKTITLKPSVEPGRYQSIHYGTTRWVEAYGQRPKVEAGYAHLKTNFSSIRRGSYRYFGKAIPTIFIGLALMWINHMILRSFDHRFNIKR